VLAADTRPAWRGRRGEPAPTVAERSVLVLKNDVISVAGIGSPGGNER
jgi:hypothetical protein